MSLSLSLTPLTVKVPDDILLEILARLPADSVTRFKCVSKLWCSLISSRYFTNLFFKFSTKRERRVFVYTDDFSADYMLFSSSLIMLDATTSFVQLNRDLTLPCINKDCWVFQNAIRGLMCFRVDRVYGYSQIHIINFTTRQVLSLPPLASNMLLESKYLLHYLGYNPINDEYKVLCTIFCSTEETNEWRSKIQVFVLGDGASWRNSKSLTFCPPHHRPHGVRISINGILYYGAASYENRSVLMRFDFNSEESNLIELPLEYRIKLVNLMNYQDQVAVFDDSRLNNECILDIWMLEDAGKSKWSRKVLVLPCHQIRATLELLELDIDDFDIEGTNRSGELMLCGGRKLNRNKQITHAFYDLEKNRITRGVVLEPPYPDFVEDFIGNFIQMYIWDDVESIMYLEA